MAKIADSSDYCPCCNSRRYVRCEDCGGNFMVLKGKIKPHDRSVCKNSHMEWGSCPGSSQPAPAVPHGAS